MSGYRGFESKEAYERYYGNINNYRDELSSMETYTREAEQERENFKMSNVNISFSGKQGSGKTRLSVIVFQHLKELGFDMVLENTDEDKITVMEPLETLDGAKKNV